MEKGALFIFLLGLAGAAYAFTKRKPVQPTNSEGQYQEPDYQYDSSVPVIDDSFVEEAVQAVAVDLTGAPLSVRNNNPGNVKWFPAFSYKWRGQVGIDQYNHVKFDTPENGARAMARDISNKHARGLNTISMILSAYAPDASTASMSNYIEHVSAAVGVYPNAVITNIDWMLREMMRAMIDFESGGNWGQHFSDVVIASGVNARWT